MTRTAPPPAPSPSSCRSGPGGRAGSFKSAGGSPLRGAFSRDRHDSGLTLLEVLVSLAILGLGLAFVMQGVAQGVAVRRASAETQDLALLVQDRLNDLLARGEAPEGPEEGERDELRWRVERESAPGDPGETATVVLRIVAEAPSGRSLEVMTLMPPAGKEQ